MRVHELPVVPVGRRKLWCVRSLREVCVAGDSSAPAAHTHAMTSESTLDIRPAAVRWATVAALLAAGGYLLARYVGVGPPGGPWAYWPIQGLLCGILFRRPLREWAYIVVATVVAQVLTIDIVRGNLASGATPFGAAAGAAQAMLGAWILRRQSLGDSPLESPTVLAWFVAVGVAFVPLVMSPLSAAAFSLGLDLPFRAAWGPLFVGNSLSMLLVSGWPAGSRRSPVSPHWSS
jgi:hypothetical protein